MKLVLSSAALVIASSSSGVVAADGQRRLRHGVTSEDEAYVAHRGHYSSGRTYDKPICIGQGCGPHSGGHHSGGHHYENSRQVANDYDRWKNAHQHHYENSRQVANDYDRWKDGHHWHTSGHYHCAWGKCDEEEAKVLDNFFDEYDKKDMKVLAKFFRSGAYEDYVESEDYN